ncbi:MAG: hypothetical protein GEU87_14045 [Alphaproteobacteria bacterium]|nr:hypothetical protein [Alphaproteobacteria bacterium]
MAKKSAAHSGQTVGFSGLLQVGLWIIILVFAFFMQVIPFLLVLTMFNLAVGISSGVALILIPAVAFGMLSLACWVATRRTRNILPDPLPQPGFIAPFSAGGGNADAPTTHQRLIPLLQRWRWRFY